MNQFEFTLIWIRPAVWPYIWNPSIRVSFWNSLFNNKYVPNVSVVGELNVWGTAVPKKFTRLA